MNFRTEIDIRPDRERQISHDDRIVMLGSCFTDNVGEILEKDGFNVAHNPMGPLYNPCSISNAIKLATGQKEELSMLQDDAGVWHCLDFASRYAHPDRDMLEGSVRSELEELRTALSSSSTAIFTLGTAYVFSLAQTGEVVGNCHKFPASVFTRRMLSAGEIEKALLEIVDSLPWIKNVIFTVSPIRHVGDGLHGNQLSKSALLLGLDAVQDKRSIGYFPAYEIVLDDLRDYRFYAADMKHPSEVAVDYIYEKFQQAYFDSATIAKSAERRKAYLRSQHRTII